MNKIKLRMTMVVFLLASSAVLADNKAIEISIGGIGPGVDIAALETVQQVIGQAVANGVITKYSVTGAGIEGGFSACAEASANSKGFNNFVKQLRTIKPNPKTSFYALNKVASCQEQMTFCTQDVKMCSDGSYVSRVAPSCAFTPCPGE